jgi:hypothetical protein
MLSFNVVVQESGIVIIKIKMRNILAESPMSSGRYFEVFLRQKS